MLGAMQRLQFVAQLVLLLVSGVMEMTSFLLIYGFIGGLRVDVETGGRGGKLGQVLERVGVGHFSQYDYVVIVGGFVLGFLLLKNLLSMAIQFSLSRFLSKLNERVCTALFDGYLVMPLDLLHRKGPAEAGRDIKKVFSIFTTCFNAVSQILVDGTTLTMVAGLLLFIDPVITLGAAAWFMIGGMIGFWGIRRLASGITKEAQKAKTSAGDQLSDGMAGIIDVRLRDRRVPVLKNYRKALSQSSMYERRLKALDRAPKSTNEILLASALIGSVAYVVFSGSAVEEALPMLGIFAFAGLRMTGAMSRLSKSLQCLRRATPEFEEAYKSVVASAPEVVHAVQQTERSYLADEVSLLRGDQGKLKMSLQAKNISFTYQDASTPAVDRVSLTIPQGRMVAFCGPSGGGKSTLVLCLMGLLRPQSGEVFCDDWSIFQHIRSWHKQIGYVGQDPYFPKRSIAQNVALGLPAREIDVEKVWAALELASADSFVRALPKQINTQLRRNGKNISGGQRQRILLARALYHDPDVLVLDEATAALDVVTEREVSAAIQKLSRKKTLICIAHRLSTIRDSDQIHVIEQGRIVASGTYQELVASSKLFQRLALQAEASPRTEQSLLHPGAS